MTSITNIDCRDQTARQVNQALRAALAAGESVSVAHPEARHNLGVALLQPGHVAFEGSVGYYCGGMNDGATIEIRGSAGNSAAASIRGGTVVVRGDAGARAGVAMKGGMLLVEGDAAYMTGFMMQRGVIIICGNAGEALADSMYEGKIFIAGQPASLGNDAIVEQPTDQDRAMIDEALRRYGFDTNRTFRKIVAGRKLWNFEKKDLGVWKEAL